MSIVWFLLSFALTFAALLFALPGCIEIYQRFRRTQFVICPRTTSQGTIEVSAGLAAASSAVMPTRLHIRGCSLWSGRGGCKWECLAQIRPGLE